MRTLIQSEEFIAYYNNLPEKIRAKFDHAMNVLTSIDVPNTKFAKKLVNTDFYEIRVSVGPTNIGQFFLRLIMTT